MCTALSRSTIPPVHATFAQPHRRSLHGSQARHTRVGLLLDTVCNHFSWTYLVQRCGFLVLDTNPSFGAWWNRVDGQGTHGDENLGEVDALLPGATFVEKEGIYVNTEGRPQR